MPSPEKPTVVLIQGTFQLPDVYHKFAHLLESHSFPVTLTDDAQVVETAIRNLVEEDRKTVILVMHSYGGLVGSESAPKSLTLKTREERGLSGGVAYLFYTAAFVLSMGQSVASAVGHSANHEHWDGRFMVRDPGTTLYNDLPEEEAAVWADKVVPQSSKVKDTVMGRYAYGYVPSVYVVCMRDRAVLPEGQEMFARMAVAMVREVDAGHSVLLSRPEEMVALLEEMVLMGGGE
ncbi:alpha/beta-hydrolase [Amniculicola lignicola CBS 123094]|uniref:Alpha/beta-hydrolase n=1 Tax=Amniculicola lignicola CBS 123094 TaxID=1392246 RepID=A0A6A5X3T6_9PLEO|nr:alpha/beta-hydrolase [Amniculicola lignicola CBS 123094]